MVSIEALSVLERGVASNAPLPPCLSLEDAIISASTHVWGVSALRPVQLSVSSPTIRKRWSLGIARLDYSNTVSTRHNSHSNRAIDSSLQPVQSIAVRSQHRTNNLVHHSPQHHHGHHIWLHGLFRLSHTHPMPTPHISKHGMSLLWNAAGDGAGGSNIKATDILPYNILSNGYAMHHDVYPLLIYIWWEQWNQWIQDFVFLGRFQRGRGRMSWSWSWSCFVLVSSLWDITGGTSNNQHRIGYTNTRHKFGGLSMTHSDPHDASSSMAHDIKITSGEVCQELEVGADYYFYGPDK